MFRSLILFCVAGLSAVGLASGTVEINFPDAKARTIFEAPSDPTVMPKAAMSAAGDKVSYTLKSDREKDKLYIIDDETGNVYAKTIGEVKNGSWTFVPTSEPIMVYQAKVLITAEGAPAAAANVDLTDGLRKQSQLLAPSNKGEVTFSFLRLGEITVKVNYSSNGKPASPVEQTFKLERVREQTVPTFKVALPEPTDKVGTAATPADASKAPAAEGKPAEPKGTGGGFLSNLIMTLIGLGIAGGIAYFAFKFMRSNPDQVKDTLTKLGADIPKPADPDMAAPIVQEAKAPEPVPQIILQSDPVAPAPPMAATGIPTLVSADGSRFEIPEGETTVGREFGVGLVVPNDTISRKHAIIRKSGAVVEVSDAGSTNGTWINFGQISTPVTLKSGDSVRFGSAEFRYEA